MSIQFEVEEEVVKIEKITKRVDSIEIPVYFDNGEDVEIEFRNCFKDKTCNISINAKNLALFFHYYVDCTYLDVFMTELKALTD